MNQMNQDNIRTYTCILCPRGCELKAEWVWQEEGGERKKELRVSGNFCPRGVQYAIEEETNPKRTVTTSLYLAQAKEDSYKMVSVKTNTAIPKEKIPQVLREAAVLRITPPIEVGQVLTKNIADTGADLVATRRIEVAEGAKAPFGAEEEGKA